MARILCIEDEADLREDVVDELADAGHEVIEAANGADGLQAFLRHRPDLVLCDCIMPIMSGIDLLVALRQDYPQFNDIPFAFYSANANQVDVEERLALGAQAYLTKPADFDVLLTTVEDLLKPKRRRSRGRRPATTPGAAS